MLQTVKYKLLFDILFMHRIILNTHIHLGASHAPDNQFWLLNYAWCQPEDTLKFYDGQKGG